MERPPEALLERGKRLDEDPWGAVADRTKWLLEVIPKSIGACHEISSSGSPKKKRKKRIMYKEASCVVSGRV